MSANTTGSHGTPTPKTDAESATEPLSPIIPLVLAVALFMEQMDATVIATSLAAIANDINTEPVALKLALTSYLVALAIFIPVSGWIADQLGARRVFRWAIFVFVIGSMACALSNSLLTFVLSRFLQGTGAALMSPIARLVLVRLAPKNQLVEAMSWLTIPALIGPIVGPPLGGFFTTYFSWHWIFFINVPIGLIGIALATRFLPRTGYRDYRHIDGRGFIMTGICFSGVVFGLSVISLPALPPVYGIVGIVIGLIAGLVYLRHLRHTEEPLLDPRILKNPVFSATLWGGSIFRIGIGAFGFLTPLMLQLFFGYSPFEAGLITFVSAIGAIVIKLFIGRLLFSYGYRPVMLIAILLSSVSVAALALLPLGTPGYVFMGVLLFGGFVRSTYFTSDGSLSYATIRQEETGPATAIIAVGQQISVAIGVAIAGLVLEMGTNGDTSQLSLQSFHTTYLVMAAIIAVSFFWTLRLPKDAGAEASGHDIAGH